MTITAVSSIALAVKGVIDLVAGSATFQQRIGDFHEITVSEANARDYIFAYEAFKKRLDTTEHHLAELRPFAVVGLSESDWSAIVQCSVLQYLPSGMVVLVLTDEARYTDCYGEDAEHDYNDSYLDALNFFGGVVDDWNANTEDTPFPPGKITILESPFRTERADRRTEDFWTIILGIQFGEAGQ